MSQDLFGNLQTCRQLCNDKQWLRNCWRDGLEPAFSLPQTSSGKECRGVTLLFSEIQVKTSVQPSSRDCWRKSDFKKSFENYKIARISKSRWQRRMLWLPEVEFSLSHQKGFWGLLVKLIILFKSTFYMPDPHEGHKYSGRGCRQGLCFLAWLIAEVKVGWTLSWNNT